MKLRLRSALLPLVFSTMASANVGVVSQWVMPTRPTARFEIPPVERTHPVVVGDILYSANLDGNLLAIHRTDGYVLWEKKVGGDVEGALTYARSKVFVGDTTGNFMALNARDGSPAWTFKTQGEWLAAPAVMRDKVFVISSADELYALGESTGKEIWHYSHRGDEKMTVRGTSTPVPFGDAVFYGTSDGFLIALSTADGKVLWNKRLRTRDRFYDVDMMPFVDERSVIAGTFDGRLFSLDRLTGNTQWIFPAGVYGGVLVEENRVYFAGLDGNFYAIDRTNGQPVWKTPFGKGVGVSPVRAGDYLVFATSGDPVYIVDPKDGKIAWKGNLGAGTLAAPAGNADGWFYLMSNYGNLYSYEIHKDLLSLKGPETIPASSAIYKHIALTEPNPITP